MANKIPSVVIDACVLIDMIQNSEPGKPLYPQVKPIIDEAKAGKIQIVLSTLILSECGVNNKEQQQLLDDFLENDYIEIQPASEYVAKEAKRVRSICPMNTIDSVHVATATSTSSHFLITRDGDGKKTRRKLLPSDKKLSCADGAKLRIMTLTQYNDERNASEHPLYVTPPEDKINE